MSLVKRLSFILFQNICYPNVLYAISCIEHRLNSDLSKKFQPSEDVKLSLDHHHGGCEGGGGGIVQDPTPAPYSSLPFICCSAQCESRKKQTRHLLVTPRDTVL